MFGKLCEKVRPWLPRTLDQIYDTGGALSTISIRLDSVLRTLQIAEAHPSLVTWVTAIYMLIGLVFAVWTLMRAVRKVNQANQKANPPDANQNGLTFGRSEDDGQA